MSATTPTVQEAWAKVMADVRSLGKDQRTDSGARFNFRGVDDVMNAVGPVLRDHGVSVIPTKVTTSHRDVTTSKGAVQREATVVVEYAIHGPAGDSMPGASAGESADSGDKGTPKAMSVAYRTFLLQALCLPTQEVDPDQHHMERAPEPTPDELAQQCYTHLLNATTPERVRELGNQAHELGVLDIAVHGTVLRAHVAARLEGLTPKTDDGAATTAA